MAEKPESIVLLSGGLDSAVVLSIALEKTAVKLALSFSYGQRAASREIEAAGKLAKYYGVEHEILSLDWLGKLSGDTGALFDAAKPLPKLSVEDIASEGPAARESARAVWVPNRNALFISIAAAYADARRWAVIVAGFNREEAATFPDNTPYFVSAMNSLLKYSTMTRPRVESYTINMDKNAIFKEGRRRGIPLEHCWSCYDGAETQCGVCESCVRFRRAARENNDPLAESFARGDNG